MNNNECAISGRESHGQGVKNNLCIKSRPQCVICGKNISDRRNLVRHLRRIHCIEPLIRKPQLKCSYNDDCTFLCATSELLREHLKSAHDFDTEKIVLSFKCREDFEKWKHKEEVNTNARYVAYTGTKFRGTKKIFYLKCHRSGAVRSDTLRKERKRSKPTKGYTQCGTTCPSSIRVSEAANGNIQVLYYPIHLGHTLDDESIQYMKLSSKDKEEIVGKLAQGEPIGKIVSDARKKKGMKLSRINLLQRRDVYNIKKKVNYLEKEEDKDGKVIDNWIKSLGVIGMPNDPVVLYYPMGKTKNYTLILIHNIQKIIYSVVFDGSIVYVKTKKGKPNVDFNLTAVNVICENGDGYSIAFCISHKTEYVTFYTFFKIVYQNFGTIKAQIFVSDNSSPLYLAWKNVMGECDNKLICTFDIQSQWEQKLAILKCPVGKQEEINKQLKFLLHLYDKDEFETYLSKFLKYWNDDNDTRIFHNYFNKFYGKKSFEWATCYRINSVSKENINDCLEPLNNALDSIYMESYCSLENSLNHLFAFVRDVCLLKLLKWDEQILLEKQMETDKNHEECHNVKKVKPRGGGGWTVEENDETVYVVTKSHSDCDKKCGIFCKTCDLCVHNYNCVCSDFVVGFNICKHVHAIAMLEEKMNTSESLNRGHLASKNTAVTLAKSLALDLSDSNLPEETYIKIIENLTNLKKDLAKECWTIGNHRHKMSLKIKSNSSPGNKHSSNVSNIICDGDLVVSGSDDGKIKIWKPDLNFVSEMEAPAGILSLAACDNLLYSCSADGSIQSWDLKTGRNSSTLSTTLYMPQKLFINKSSNILWAGDSQGNVAKYENGVETGKFELVEEVWDLINYENLIYTARDRDLVIAELVNNAGKSRVAVKSTLQGRSPLCIVGDYFCFLNRDGRNIQIHKNSLSEKFSRVQELVASDLIINALASDGNNCIFSAGYDCTVKKWNLKNFNCIGSINIGCCINALACKSEKEVYLARSDGVVTKVDG